MKDILHLTNFLPEEDYTEILNIVNKINYNHDYHLSWKLTGSTQIGKTRFWNCRLDREGFFTDYLLQKIVKIIHDNTGEKVVRCERAYLNGATFGHQGYLHPDSFDSNGRTLLIYCNSEWQKEWAGGTVFDCGDSDMIFLPRPNSCIYFDSTILHHSQPTSKFFNGLRVTLAYKLFVECND